MCACRATRLHTHGASSRACLSMLLCTTVLPQPALVEQGAVGPPARFVGGPSASRRRVHHASSTAQRTTARACLPVFARCRPVSPAARLRSCRIRPTHDSRSSTAAARPRPCRWTAGMHACHRLAQGEMGLVRSSIHQFLLEDFSYPVLFGEPLLCGWCATVTSDVSSFASPPTGSARSLCDSVATRQASISAAL
jgi:hypothetical protein